MAPQRHRCRPVQPPAPAPHLKPQSKAKANCRRSPKKIVAPSQNGRRRVGSGPLNCNQRLRTQVSTMLLEHERSLKFGRQKNHKNSLLALSSYIFFFFCIFPSVPRRYKPSSFAICVNWIPRKIKKSETQLSTLKHQHSL